MSTSNDGGNESFAAMFEMGSAPQRQRRLSIGDEVEGVVVKIGSDAIFLDLDGKREAFIDRATLNDAEGHARLIEVGDKMQARVAELGGRSGGIRLEPVAIHRKAREQEEEDVGEQVELVDNTGPRLATGAHVKGQVVRVEPYGVFVQIDGTTGREGRGLLPAVETGLPRGSDLRKKFPIGMQVDVKILHIADDGKIRLSVRGLEADEERASFEKYAGKEKGSAGGAGFGTLADAFSRIKTKKKR